MNRRVAGIVLTVVSALCVGFMAFVATDRKSPGPISSVHAGLEKIDGGAACSQCHGGLFGSMRKSCLECHADIGAQLEAGNGLHGRLGQQVAGNCASCHGEHHGGEFRLVNRLAFAQAGVADINTFDHAMIGFAMSGKHLELSCTACHENAEVEVLAEGQKRYLGRQQDCATCHADPHGGRMQLDCVTCHGQDSFRQRFVPGHEQVLSLSGGHAEVGCRDCHAEGGAHALERLLPDAERKRGCADCHESQHSTAFLAGNARLAGVSTADSCGVCHTFDRAKFTDAAVTVTPEQHVFGGFDLAAPHDQVACDKCHTPGVSWNERHPGRKANDCRVCHADPHGGQFDKGPYAAQGCVSCHAVTHFAPPQFGVPQHAKTTFPLDGGHLRAACEQCHLQPTQDTPRMFHGTPTRCEQCHVDAHEEAFADHSPILAANPRGACAECHGTDAFAKVDHAVFDHGRWAGFKIYGAHDQIDCVDCHVPQQGARPQRRLGRVTPPGQVFAGCVACHDDPHEGRFDRDAANAVVDGRSGCERCHDSISFRALPNGFDHERFAGYPLGGAHQKLDCSACHAPLDTPTENGRTWGKPRGRECSDCHADPHQRQFERLGATDCARCHKSATRFATLSFRHNLDSNFPLGEAHKNVACSGCHKVEDIDGVQAVRYKPLPTECSACHGDDAASRRRRGF